MNFILKNNCFDKKNYGCEIFGTYQKIFRYNKLWAPRAKEAHIQNEDGREREDNKRTYV